MADEQTEVERLKDEKARIDADLAAAVRLADQCENLLPKLEAKLERVNAKLRPLDDESSELSAAIHNLQAGVPTDYHLRKPPATTPAEGA